LPSRIRDGAIVPREYQTKIASSALKSNTLVVLPTGLGKTMVALLVSDARLQSGDSAKILFLAPTKPLADQHYNTFRGMLDYPDPSFSLLTGDIAPEKRQEVWSEARLIFATPETVLNDLNSGRASLRDFVLVVFDEAHRCVKEYAYTEIARQYVKQAEDQLILGLTASPGGSEERIKDVMRNLFIERVEARTESDEDVRPYVEETEIQTIRVALPPAYVQVADQLRQLYSEKLAKLRRFGFLRFKGVTKKMLLQSRIEILQKMKGSNRRMYLFGALFVQSQAVMILHAIELIETQGAPTLNRYLTKFREDPEQGRAGKALMKDERWVEVEARAGDLCVVEHPKMEKLRSLLGEQMAGKPNSRIIVFTQYRDTIELILSAIAALGGVTAEKFVGQATRSATDVGLKQREQAEVLGRFRDGAFNVLVSSRIGEEGLHVPDVDLVVFYEAVPSEIRSIQRRGRTGRTMPGRVVILLAEGTIDEAYFRTTAYKEKRMRSLIEGEREIDLGELQADATETGG
jgi:Fanconi anemia group M protein